jgi:anti-sigma B factor antagonist
MGYHLTEPETKANVRMIEVGGELDVSAAPALREALDRAIDARAAQVFVDLTDTTFVDSATIGVLLGASKRVREAAGRLHVICSNRHILGIFEIAGLDQHIPIWRSRREALE